MPKFTGKDFQNGAIFGALFGALVMLLYEVLSRIGGLNTTFATAGAQITATSTTGAGIGIGQWIISRTRIPLGEGLFQSILIGAIGGIAIFLLGKLILSWLTFIPTGKTAFSKLFAILLTGSAIVTWLVGGIGGNWNPFAGGINWTLLITLIVSSAIYSWIFTSAPTIRNWTSRFAGL